MDRRQNSRARSCARTARRRAGAEDGVHGARARRRDPAARSTVCQRDAARSERSTLAGDAAVKCAGECVCIRSRLSPRVDAVFAGCAKPGPSHDRRFHDALGTSSCDIRRLVRGASRTQHGGAQTIGVTRSMSLRYLTAGESHGQALVGIIEGIPAGLELSAAYLHAEAKRRKLGFGRGNRQNIETDEIRIVAGVRFGRTLGSPIALIIENRDWRSWSEIMAVESPADEAARSRRAVSVPRPGHADRIGGIKYDHADMRNVLERASARETAMRVALGSVARRFLEEFGIRIQSRVVRIG